MIKAIKNDEVKDEKNDMLNLAKEFNDKVPNEILSLFSNEEKHKTIVEKEEIKNTIIEWIKK